MRIIIIGAGIAGLSIGWRLAEAGADTVVLERAQPGRGATWASAGMLAATVETGVALDSEIAFARKSMDLWPAFVRSLEEASGQSVGYRRDGALLVAGDSSEAETLKARAAAAGVGFLSPDETLGRVPALAPDIQGALWAPDEAQVDNRALGRALANAFLNAGGNLQTNESAVRIESFSADTVGVRTPFALHVGDAVILAAGAWSAQLEGLPAEAVPPVRPVKGEMIALSAPTGTPLPKPLVWGNEIYLVPRGQRLLVGATATDSGYDTALTTEARDWLHGQAVGLMPELASWDVAEHWAGLRPGSPDGLPILGETAVPGVYVASGQYRNGILFAPAIAEVVKTLVLDRHFPPEIAAFDPKRFHNDTSLATGDGVQ
jgi:glycine oxidase